MILAYPNPKLRIKADPIEESEIGSPELEELIEKMIKTMREADGVGLAAIQIGVPKSLFVCSMGGDVEVVINPDVIAGESSITEEEACLSLPGFSAKVKRSLKIDVVYHNREGKTICCSYEGHMARVFQHEIDHLNGVLIIDYVSQIYRDRYKKQLKKSSRASKKHR
jgi:peptide deformylase